MKLDNHFLRDLESRLAEPLPGMDAQFLMAPAGRPRPGGAFQIPEDARQSAVLICLYPGSQGMLVPMILRQDYKGVHSNQVGLPGGGVEKQDPDLVGTALREAEEELAIPSREVEILGGLSPMYIPPSNYLVQPYVGTIRRRPDFIPDPVEVADLIEAEVLDFLRPQKRVLQDMEAGGKIRRNIPGYMIGQHLVWGATAMMMSEFASVLEELIPAESL